jgi:hypothetical protein
LIACYQKEFLGPEATILATNKIIELSKRNRHLTAELECSKAKSKNYNRKITKLEWDLQATFNENKRIPQPPPTQSEVDCLAKLLTENKVKLTEILNVNASLKNELKVMHKCLQQEIGESVNVNSLLAVGSTWRGRAQIILGLQQKVVELKQKLETPNYTSIQQHPMKKSCSARIENARKFAETEQLTKVISSLQQQLDDHKFKLGALKSRNKTMCDEVSDCKLKILEQMEKSRLDEKCIACLNLKVESLTWDYELKLTKMLEQVDIATAEKMDIELQKMQAMLKTENALQELENKEKEVALHKTRVEELEKDVRALAGDFLFTCRDMKKDQFLAMLEALEAQVKSLLQQISDGNKALSSERSERGKQDSLVARLKIRAARLEKRLSNPIFLKLNIGR